MESTTSLKAEKLLIAYKRILLSELARLQSSGIPLKTKEEIRKNLPSTVSQIFHQINLCENDDFKKSITFEVNSIKDQIDVLLNNNKSIYKIAIGDKNNKERNDAIFKKSLEGLKERSRLNLQKEKYQSERKKLFSLVFEGESTVKLKSHRYENQVVLSEKIKNQLDIIRKISNGYIYELTLIEINTIEKLINKLNKIRLGKHINRSRRNLKDKKNREIPSALVSNDISGKTMTLEPNSIDIQKKLLFSEISRLDKIYDEFNIKFGKITSIIELSEFIDEINKSILLAIKFSQSLRAGLSKKSYLCESVYTKFETISKQINKLDDLQRQARSEVERILKMPEIICKSISWDNIIFQDGRVSIAIRRLKPEILPESRSKKVYNILKHHLYSFGNIVVQFNTRKSKIVNWKGIDLLDSIFERLEVEQELKVYDLGNVAQFEKIYNYCKKSFIVKNFSLAERSKYFDFLCGACNETLRIVPVKEYFLYESSENYVIEDAFLFPLALENYIYIIWESVEEGQATHVFRSLKEHHIQAMQIVFDYASSMSIRNKLQLLHNSRIELFEKSVIRYLGSVKHTKNDFESWQKNLITRLLS